MTDFGLSKIVIDDDPLATSLCGTPEYLAPEILTTSIIITYDKKRDMIKHAIGGVSVRYFMKCWWERHPSIVRTRKK